MTSPTNLSYVLPLTIAPTAGSWASTYIPLETFWQPQQGLPRVRVATEALSGNGTVASSVPGGVPESETGKARQR